MKRKITTLLLLLILIASSVLASCASNTFVMIYHETYEYMSNNLSFPMETVPGEENVIIYGTMDKNLGEIKYSVINEGERMNGTLAVRMATLDYAEKYTTDKTPGIAGIEADAATSTERIGSCEVTYYVSGQTVFAVWIESTYAYSVTFTFSDSSVTPDVSDIRDYAIALISTASIKDAI